MRVILIAFVLYFLFPFLGLSKDLKGIIYTKNDTIEVTFNVPYNNFKLEILDEKIRFKIKYYDSFGKKKVIRVDECIGITIKNNGRWIKFVSIKNLEEYNIAYSGQYNIFVRQEIKDKVSLYSYKYEKGGVGLTSGNTFSSGTASGKIYFLQYKNNLPVKIIDAHFKEQMNENFYDCPSLIEKVDNKAFKKGDIHKVVNYYNSNCI